MKEIKLIFFDNCDTCNQEYHHYEFIFGYLNLCIDCYCKLTNKKQPKVVKSIKNFYKRIDDLGGEVIGEYKGSGTQVDCICSNDHPCNPNPNNINNGLCKICAGNDSETAKHNFYDNIKKLGGTVIGKYKKSDIPVDCRCKEGHNCNPRPSDIQQGHGMCKSCCNSRGYSKIAISWLNSISNSIQHVVKICVIVICLQRKRRKRIRSKSYILFEI